ncbi:SurA N-terminal domain-containing protein [Pseudomaricurvus sp.]|uniref:SurA N-terminal domain-containing protein n=1 Tax=Pseudomaricurvus sp. TaxID=2004510 RepID=UPI003F6CB070
MLQAFRDNLKGAMAIFIVGLMMIPFALFGVDSLFLQDSTAGKAAEVNGAPVSEMELTRAVRIQKQQLLERFGEQAPADLVSDEQLRGPVLTRLVNRELLRQAAENGGMAISDADVNQMIISTPQFQQDGRFSADLYTQLLRNMGYTPASYKALLIEDLLVNQHASGLNASAFATEGDIRTLTALTQQMRSFYYLTLPFDSVVDQVSISDEEIQSYYDDNQPQFMEPERVSVEYIDLNLDDLAQNTGVDPEEVKAQYEQNVASFTASTKRHAAHILIEDGDEAEKKIAQVQDRLNSGEDFATVAGELSDDFGSKEMGGDVGMTDGTTFPEAFEGALSELEVGEVSDPVETDAGTHFIKLLDIEDTNPPSFESAKAGIEERLARATAESTFVELLEALPDATYNAESLSNAADGLGIEAKTSELFDRQGGPGILSNNQVLAAVFSEDVLHDGLASNVIDLTDNHVVVVKLKEHKQPEVKPLTEVSEEVKAILTKQKVENILSEQAQEYAGALEEGENLEALATEKGVDWQVKTDVQRNDRSMDMELLSHIFTLPKPQGSEPVNTTLTLANGDTVVAQLTVVKPGELPELDESQLTGIKQRLAQDIGGAEMATYQNSLNDSADVEVY